MNQTMTAFGTYFVIAFQSVGGSTRYAGIALFLASVTNVPSMLFASKVIKSWVASGRCSLVHLFMSCGGAFRWHSLIHP